MLARVTIGLWFLLFILLDATYAAERNETMTCRPFGRCEPCPENSLHEPFCQPFGNRRLVHCSLDDDPTTSSSTPSSQRRRHGRSAHLRSEGERPAWESCGRIVSKERSDYFEFILCNALFAAAALSILFARSRRMEIMHARQLAARIGLVRGGGGAWVH